MKKKTSRGRTGASARPGRKKVAAAKKKKSPRRYWSGEVTRKSDALDLEKSVFTRSPSAMARSLKRSAEHSRRRKSSPFQSAMSMLTFYENRAGKTLSASRRAAITRAKTELRRLFGRDD
jgi:hypothetical protein